MKACVDPDRCQGHTRCWAIVPEVFSLDDEGHAYVSVADVPEPLVPKVLEAVRNCPEGAIDLIG